MLLPQGPLLSNCKITVSLSILRSGTRVFHSFLCIIIQFLLLRLMGRTVTCVLSSFTFQMVRWHTHSIFVSLFCLFRFYLVDFMFVWQIYLLMGYYYTATDEYDIKWTMPHCVLTLKLIGMICFTSQTLLARFPRQGLNL